MTLPPIAEPPGSSSTWPPQFPHAEIDELIQRLATTSEEADSESAERLLQLIAREAQRLRNAVVKLSVARISAAEREAHEILSDAQSRADQVRRRALTALDDRLDEADQVVRAMRRSFLVEHRLRGNTEQAPRDPAAHDDTDHVVLPGPPAEGDD